MAIHLRRNDLYAGIDPGTGDAYANRTSAGPWEAATITPQKQWSDIQFNGLQFCVNEETKQLESRPKGDIWGWGGQWQIWQQPSAGWLASCDAWTFTLEGYAVATPIHLEQRGNDFVDATGNRIVLPGIDAFPALRFWRDGGPDALKALIDESVRLGFKVWRIWSQGSKKQNNFLDLSPTEAGYYDSISPFTDHLNKNGLIPLLTAYVDNQDVKSPVTHWTDLTSRGKGKQALWSGFNQWSKNKSDFDPWALPAPYSGAIWSRGSDTDDVMTAPKGAAASELHATRISFERALMDATASPPTMRKPENGSGMVWMTEGNPFGDSKGYSENQAWKLGRGYSIEWALAVFHNRQSQFGQLMNADTSRCAAQWVKGLTL